MMKKMIAGILCLMMFILSGCTDMPEETKETPETELPEETHEVPTTYYRKFLPSSFLYARIMLDVDYGNPPNFQGTPEWYADAHQSFMEEFSFDKTLHADRIDPILYNSWIFLDYQNPDAFYEDFDRIASIGHLKRAEISFKMHTIGETILLTDTLTKEDLFLRTMAYQGYEETWEPLPFTVLGHDRNTYQRVSPYIPWKDLGDVGGSMIIRDLSTYMKELHMTPFRVDMSFFHTQVLIYLTSYIPSSTTLQHVKAVYLEDGILHLVLSSRQDNPFTTFDGNMYQYTIAMRKSDVPEYITSCKIFLHMDYMDGYLAHKPYHMNR